MALLGERNWYLPKWLNRLPDLTHDEAADAVATPAARDDEGEPVRV
jgi:RND superfamily putative drug exporter